MAEDEGGGVALGQVDRRVRQWLKGVRLSVIAVVLEAIRDELESRARAAGSRAATRHRAARRRMHGPAGPARS